ncbi:hypothetical protein AB8A05_03935 [Tardiphaga sp. 538_B7_N1_4]|uniref:hypothetical protein n=1 Tax=Tardiphaga sp. 538_B7_N1_4 TaxID=3240778 RepID=UPI003F204714
MTQDIEPTPAQIAKFRRAAKSLAELGRAGLFIYLANDTFNLMTGPSHDERQNARADRVRAYVTVPRAGGGDW